MAEQRLIDATDLIARGNASFGGVSDAVLLKKFVDAQPTIDPESLPIVRQLREDLARATAERDAAVKDLKTAMKIDSEADDMGLSCFLCHVCIKNDTCDGACNPKWRGQKKEAEQ